MRTQEQVVERVKAAGSNIFDFSADIYLDYLDFEHADLLLKGRATKETWEVALGDFSGFGPPTNRTRPIPLDDRNFILESMRHYMGFAWDKVLDQRGISAMRSVQKFSAWLWLLEDDELSAELLGEYHDYGAVLLEKVCVKYGFESRYMDTLDHEEEEGEESSEEEGASL